MSEITKVEDCFKGIEGHYDTKMTTVFTVKDFAPEFFYTEAENDFYRKRIDFWKEELFNLGIRMGEIHLIL